MTIGAIITSIIFIWRKIYLHEQGISLLSWFIQWLTCVSIQYNLTWLHVVEVRFPVNYLNADWLRTSGSGQYSPTRKNPKIGTTIFVLVWLILIVDTKSLRIVLNDAITVHAFVIWAAPNFGGPEEGWFVCDLKWTSICVPNMVYNSILWIRNTVSSLL